MPKPRKTYLRLTDEQVATIERLAGLQFSLDEIALMMELPPSDLMASKKADEVWWRSSLRAQESLRRTLEGLAKEGDVSALKLYLSYIETSRK